MANKYCVAFNDEEYKESIRLLREGFKTEEGVQIRPNDRIATIVQLEATLGLRIGDILRLSLSSFIRDGDRYKINIVEEKTSKIRRYTVPDQIYIFIQDYALRNNIGFQAKLFPISERQVERHLNKVFSYMHLNIKNYGTHSYRKFFSQKVYIDNSYNLLLVQKLLQHSSPNITQRYLGISNEEVENALQKTANYLIVEDGGVD